MLTEKQLEHLTDWINNHISESAMNEIIDLLVAGADALSIPNPSDEEGATDDVGYVIHLTQ